MSEQPVVRVAFLDVGQGDTIVISLPETKEGVVVDCVDANAVISYLERERIQHLRGLLVTHLHLDHYGGVAQFLNNLELELGISCERVFFHRPLLSKTLHKAIFNDEDNHGHDGLDEKTSKRKSKHSIINLLRWAKRNRERFNSLTIQPGITLPFEDVIELIHPWDVDVPELLSQGLNNTSAVIKVKGRSSSALLTGDIEPLGWSYITDKDKLKSDVLKFPHHGAWKDDSVSNLLTTVEPSLIVISVGTSGIRYGHPNTHVFEAIAQLPNVQLLCTQATTQCASHLERLKLDIVEVFRQQSEHDDFFFVNQNGCPCAGTVILELADVVNVIQPRIDFHRSKIIRRYFAHGHQCNLQN